MNLGAFSISLTFKDLAASQAFYEKLAFVVIAGVFEENWLILKNGQHIIGLFHGMFDQNMLTFNPGWDHYSQPLDKFDAVRELQKTLKAAGIQLTSEADEDSSGPASIMFTDPDGNPILTDQHV